jgi:hypothetical protein
LQMVSTIDTSRVRELQKPYLKCSSSGIEKFHLLEKLKEHDLHHVLSFARVTHDLLRDAPDQPLIAIDDDCQRIVMAGLQTSHHVFVSQRSKIGICYLLAVVQLDVSGKLTSGLPIETAEK